MAGSLKREQRRFSVDFYRASADSDLIRAVYHIMMEQNGIFQAMYNMTSTSESFEGGSPFLSFIISQTLICEASSVAGITRLLSIE